MSNYHKFLNLFTTWDGKDALGKSVASGVYFYTLHTSDEGGVGKFTATRKMVIAK